MIRKIILTLSICFAALPSMAQPGKFNQNLNRQRHFGLMTDTFFSLPRDTFRTNVNTSAYKSYPWMGWKGSKVFMWDTLNTKFVGLGIDSVYVKTGTDSVFVREYGVTKFSFLKTPGAGVYVDTVYARNDTLFYRKNSVEYAVRKITDAESVQDAIGAMINASLQYVDVTPVLAINDRDFGDITTSGSGLTWTVDDQAITYNKIQNVSAIDRVLGRRFSGGSVEELTGDDVLGMLDIFTSVDNGIVPASGGGSTNFLRADGTWGVPAGTATNNTNAGAGYRLLIPSTQGIKTIFGAFGILNDSTSNTDAITQKADTTSGGLTSWLRTKFVIDSLDAAGWDPQDLESVLNTGSNITGTKTINSSGSLNINNSGSFEVKISSGSNYFRLFGDASNRGMIETTGGSNMFAKSEYFSSPGLGNNILHSRVISSLTVGTYSRQSDTAFLFQDSSSSKLTKFYVKYLPSDPGDKAIRYNTSTGQFTIADTTTGGGGYTDEQAQDAVGAMINASLQYVDATPLLAIADRDFGDITTSGSGLTWTIDNLSVTNAKINDVAWSKVTGTPTTLSGYGITDALNSSTTSTQDGYFGDIYLFDDGTPSHYTKITNSGNNTLLRTLNLNVNDADRTISLSGDLTVSATATVSGTNTGDVTLAGTPDYITISGQVITRGLIDLATDVTGDLSFANIIQVAGFSVLGKSTTGTGDVAAITAAADEVLRRSGSGDLLFGTLVTNNIGNDQVTFAKFQNITSSRLLGRTTAAAGDVEEITVAAPLTFSSLTLDFDETATLSNNARVAVNKNSGATVGTRRRINFIEGSNITLTISDDAGNEEVDVTIDAAGGGGVNAGTALKAAYYPSTGSTVDDYAGVEYGNTNLNVKITQQATGDVAFQINKIASATANLFEINSSGGSGGDYVLVNNNGSVKAGQTLSVGPGGLPSSTQFSVRPSAINTTIAYFATDHSGTNAVVEFDNNGTAGAGYSTSFHLINATGDKTEFNFYDVGAGTAWYAEARTMVIGMPANVAFKLNTNGTDNNGFRVSTDGTFTVKGKFITGISAGDPTGSNGMFNYNSTTNKFRIFGNSSWQTIITNTAAEFSQYFDQAETAAPATPSTGFGRWYVSSTGLPRFINDAGTDYDLTAGGSGGHTIRNEGTDLTARTGLNFIGSAVNAADDAGGDETEITFDAEVNGIADLGTNGVVARTGAGTFAGRTLTGTANQVVITNGDGVSGNPTFDVGSDIVQIDLANVYTAGNKQTFDANATNADIRLTGHTADPSSLSAGDIWYESTAHILKYRGNATTRTLVNTDEAQTLTNKTVIDNVFTIEDNGDASKKAQFDGSNIPASTTITLTTPYVTSTIVSFKQTSEATNATPVPTGDAKRNEHYLTALSANATFSAPSGTLTNGNGLIIRIKDNGTARTLSWNAVFRGGTDIALPTTTVVNKTMYLGFIYNSADSKWDLIAYIDNL
jgi:hypothetical protein